MIELKHPDSEHLWQVARNLVEEYAASLDVDLAFQDFQTEIETLPTEYAAPSGCFLLARCDKTFVGCGAVRRLSDSICEMKRLYVSPAFQGRGIGRAIARGLIDHARRNGFETMVLDTLPSMEAARELYSSLGFVPTVPYRYNPLPGASFLELRLR